MAIAERNQNDYKKVDTRLAKIGELAISVRDIQLSLSNKVQAEITNDVIEKAKSDAFRILVLGEFNAGKSTFINALLGMDVLPSKMTPATAIISELKWGEKRKAILYHRNSNGKTPKPEEIPVNSIQDYVLIDDASVTRHESPFEKLELFWDLEFLKNRVELIDSPGLNDSRTSEEITTSYLGKVDAILFIMSCAQLAKDGEMQMVDYLRKLGHTHLFFVCNFYDLARKQADRDDLRIIADTRLVPMTEIGREGVFFVSALNALMGREDGDSTQVEKSGLLPLEDQLQRFLTGQRGRIKVLQPAKQLSDTIAATQTLIPQREAMLHTDRETLEERYRSIKAPMDNLQIQRANIGRRIANFRNDMRELVRVKTKDFYTDLESNISEWINGYEVREPFNPISLDLFSPKGAVSRVVNEVMAYLSSRVEQSSTQWQSETLQPFVISRLEDLKNELDVLAQAFLNDLGAIKVEITGLPKPEIRDDIEAGRVSPIERILAAATGFFLGDIVNAGVGYAFGFKAMLGNLALQIGIVVVGVLVGITNPLALLAVALGGGALGAIFKGSKTNDQIKKKVGEMFSAKIREQSMQLSETLAGKVYEKLAEIELAVDTGLRREIVSVDEQVQSVLREKEKGQEATSRELDKLRTARERLTCIKEQLDVLIHETATA